MSTAAEASVPAPGKALHYGLWAVQVLLALMFLMAGAFKLSTPAADLVTQGMAWAGRVPSWLVPVIGASEALGAVGLIVPSAIRVLPKVTALAAAGLVVVMILAAIEHAMAGEFGAVPVNAVLGGLALFVVWGRAAGAPIAAR